MEFKGIFLRIFNTSAQKKMCILTVSENGCRYLVRIGTAALRGQEIHGILEEKPGRIPI